MRPLMLIPLLALTRRRAENADDTERYRRNRARECVGDDPR